MKKEISNVVIYSKEFMLSQSLEFLFQKRFEGVKIYKDLHGSELNEVDVVVVATNKADVNFVEDMISIKQYSKFKLVILDVGVPGNLLPMSMLSKIDGYLSRGIDEDVFNFAIGKILEDRKYYDGEIVESLMKGRGDHFNGVLSEREIEIAELIQNNMTNKEIAKKLYIAESTVKRHITNIFNKLHIKTRKDLGLLNAYQNEVLS